MKRLLVTGLLGLALILSARQSLAETRTLTITARAASPATLPADAVIEVELRDVSRADAPAIRLSSQRFRATSMPVTVELRYDGDLIDDRMSYTVAARILSGNDVLYRTTAAYPALTRNAPARVAIELDRAASAAPVAASGPKPDLSGATWSAGEIGGRALVADNPPTLSFEADGSFALFGGCNRFHGRADISEGRIAFTQPLAGTRKACPPERMKLERDILGALERSAGYERNEGSLALVNEAGVVVARFQKMME